MKLQTAKWWLDHFTAQLLLNGYDKSEGWTWIGKDRHWTYLDWLEAGMTYEELAECIAKDNGFR
jgi:hypothetical protein